MEYSSVTNCCYITGGRSVGGFTDGYADADPRLCDATLCDLSADGLKALDEAGGLSSIPLS